MNIEEKNIINYLLNLSETQNLINQAIKNCKKIIFSDEVDIQEYYDCKVVDKKRFTKNDIIIEFYSQSLYFNHSSYDNSVEPVVFFDTRLIMLTNKTIMDSNDKFHEIGYYRLLTKLNGELHNYFFVLE